ADARRQDVGEADEQGRSHPATLEVAHQVEQVDAGSTVRGRAHLHPSLVVDGEEPRAPVPYAVEFDAVLDGPAVHQRLPFLQYLDAPGEHEPQKVASTPIRVCRLEHARGRDED